MKFLFSRLGFRLISVLAGFILIFSIGCDKGHNGSVGQAPTSFPSGNQVISRSVIPGVTFNQLDLLNSNNPEGDKSRLLESGLQFFSVSYTPDDGWGEGPDGPRASQSRALYPSVSHFPYIRLNGIDSQSCYECHNTTGFYTPSSFGNKQVIIRKSTVLGGAAGIASTLFQNPAFPSPLTQFLRNPPHTFGTGYSQELAAEMTEDLYYWIEVGHLIATFNPGKPVTIELLAKGVDFGTFVTTWDGSNYKDDYSKVTGVASDLIVRPFQNKGIASTMRHFVHSALQFHQSMESVEVVGTNDCDKDNIYNEMAPSNQKLGDISGLVTEYNQAILDNDSQKVKEILAKFPEEVNQSLGNVTAISSLVAMTRPPQQIIDGSLDAGSVARGEKIFKGEGLQVPSAAQKMCTTCHRDSLMLNEPVLQIETPTIQDNCKSSLALGSGTVKSSDQLLHVRQIRKKLEFAKKRLSEKKINETEPQKVFTLLKEASTSYEKSTGDIGKVAYLIDLNKPNVGSDSFMKSYVYPRLPGSAAGVKVPLFSDLKLHNMGVGLQDVSKQETDVTGVYVPAPFFLTRPLWGVGDTGPWLHDGRAQNLDEAIRYHSSQGSEANPIIDVYMNQLNQQQRTDLINFLQSLRLPQQDI